MLRLLALLTFLLTGPALAYCDDPAAFESLPAETQAALLDEARADPYGAGLLWSVEQGGVTSYVVGTMHLPDPRHAQTLAALLPLFETVDQLVVEMTSTEEQAFQKKLMDNPSSYLLTEGGSLIDRLPAAEWAALKALAQDRGLPPFMAAQMQPWFLNINLAVPTCATQEIKAGEKGLDRMLESRALSAGLTVRGLDDIDAMLKLLTSDPLEEQMADLRKSLQAGLLGKDQLSGDYSLYFKQETLLMWRANILASRQRVTDPETLAWLDGAIAELERKLLFERNLAWGPDLLRQAAHAPTIFAVGAGHLFGETGVLAQFDRAGFTMTRLPLSID